MPEVADALGVPVGTAKSRIHYAVEALRAALAADERAPIATTGSSHDDQRPICRGAHPQLDDRDRASSHPGPRPHRYVRPHASDGPGVERRGPGGPARRGRCRSCSWPAPSRSSSLPSASDSDLAKYRSMRNPQAWSIGGVWPTDAETAVTITRDPADDRQLRWRAAAYDQIGLHNLSSSIDRDDRAGPRHATVRRHGRRVDGDGLRAVSFTVRPGSFTAPTVLSPATPVFVDGEPGRRPSAGTATSRRSSAMAAARTP